MDKKNKPSTATLKKWKNLTEANLHGEVRQRIAVYFGDTIDPDLSPEGYGYHFRDAFDEINFLHGEQGSLSQGLGTARELLTKFMFEQIERVYGKEVKTAVHNCL